MKTKRLFATALAVVMLLSVFSVTCFATEETTAKYKFELTAGPTKAEYFDYERFDPSGIIVTVTDTATGAVVETVNYSSSIAYRFTFSPKASSVLTVDVAEISVTLDGQFVANVPVKVNHKWEPNTSLGSTTHATKCFGCGLVDEKTMAPHTYDDTAWTPNEDDTFARDNTESNFCLDCGHEIKREINGSAGYDVEFGEYQFLHDIMTYIDLLLDLIFGAIKR